MFVRKLQEEAEHCYFPATDSAYRGRLALLPHCHQLSHMQPAAGREQSAQSLSHWGAAHSRRNQEYRISKSDWKLPVVTHNLKAYDGHLIVKALKSEFGEVRVIPHNMEKYLSITVGRLKFIDSLQLTPQSLDSLVKTLEVDEFKYVRVSFPIAHKIELIKGKGVYPYY